MSTSGLSDLSSPLSTDDELASAPIRPGSLDAYFKTNIAKRSTPPPKKKRAPSPPHEYVLADNADIAFIVIFRSRFGEAFPKSLPHYGPQDIERGVSGTLPDEHVERLLCALLGLVLNRKKDVERGHHQRALEEAVQTHASQWPVVWQAKNPLHGGGNFNNMLPEQRLTLLRALIIWALGSSEAVQAIIKESYKQARHDDDLNQPLSVQPWGRDGDKRRFWLIEGQEDTHFRLYRESNPALKHNTWRTVAGSIDELKEVATKLGEEGTQAAKRLHDRILSAIPRFEASEDKRKRRDYRLARKAQFTRPEPGFSLYEGRTRGKRMKYTFSDEEEGGSDVYTRRSNRHSGATTPAEPAGPTFTASGRQVKTRGGTWYYEAIPNEPQEDREASIAHSNNVVNGEGEAEEATRRGRRRVGARNGVGHHPRPRGRFNGYNAVDAMDDESEATSSGGEWDGGDDEDDVNDHIGIDDEDEDDDIDMSDDGSSTGELGEPNSGAAGYAKGSLVVSLRYRQRKPNYDVPANPTDGSLSQPDLTSTSIEQHGYHQELRTTDEQSTGAQQQAPITVQEQPGVQNSLPNGVSDGLPSPRSENHSKPSADPMIA